LSGAAKGLNTTSDLLAKPISELESAIKALNLGITCWVTIHKWSSPDKTSETFDELGYAKIDGKWGFAIRTRECIDYADYNNIEGQWLFNEAPRSLRADAVEHLPKLLDALARDAITTTKKLAEKVEQARQLASAVKSTAEQPRS
jgi:hypothetical protein